MQWGGICFTEASNVLKRRKYKEFWMCLEGYPHFTNQLGQGVNHPFHSFFLYVQPFAP